MDSELAFLAKFGFIFLIVIGGLGSCIQYYSNATEVRKCESLKQQNVKAYLAEGILEKECIVLQRDLNVEQ